MQMEKIMVNVMGFAHGISNTFDKKFRVDNTLSGQDPNYLGSYAEQFAKTLKSRKSKQ